MAAPACCYLVINHCHSLFYNISLGNCIMMSHHDVMRTTIALPEHLLIEAKKLAAERHISLAGLIEESVRAYLHHEHQRVREVAVNYDLPLDRRGKPMRGIDHD